MGNNNVGGALSPNHSGQSGPEECQLRCQEEAGDGCVGFTWFLDSGDCWLKTSIGNDADSNAISGPINC